MSSVDAQGAEQGSAAGFYPRQAEPGATYQASAVPVSGFDAVKPEANRGRERFIPVTRFALIDRLTAPGAWPGGQAKDARRFFRYLDYWRRQQYNAALHVLEQTYEPFSPDSDLLMTRTFTAEERHVMQKRVVEGMTHLLEQANYVRIDPGDVELILTRESTYGLDLHVDFAAFEE